MKDEISWESGKELMAATVGVALPPLFGESVTAQITTTLTKAVVKEAIRNIPPNVTSAENTQQQTQKPETSKTETSSNTTTKQTDNGSQQNETVIRHTEQGFVSTQLY